MFRHIGHYPWWHVLGAHDRHARMPHAHALLWRELKARKILGLKFERGRLVDRQVVDFYCVRIGLAIQVDPIRAGARDDGWCERERDVRLRMLGVSVLRFGAEEVMRDLDGALSRIRRAVRYLPLRQP